LFFDGRSISSAFRCLEIWHSAQTLDGADSVSDHQYKLALRNALGSTGLPSGTKRPGALKLFIAFPHLAPCEIVPSLLRLSPEMSWNAAVCSRRKDCRIMPGPSG